MPVKVLELPIPSDVFVSLNEPEQQLCDDIRLFAATTFYQMGKLTIGKAARLAGMTRFEFETSLSTRQIPISNLTYEDIEQDIETLQGN